MFRVYLTYPGKADFDVTPLLNEDQEVTVTNERERADSTRVVEDVAISLSNFNDEFTSWLTGATKTTRLGLYVIDNDRRTFDGLFRKLYMRFDIKDELFSGTALSKTKEFWDRASSSKVVLPQYSPNGGISILLAAILSQNFLSSTYSDLFTRIYTEPNLATRSIRYNGDISDPTIGNYGRYVDLDPNTSQADLLKAMFLYYNVEVFINPETGLFHFQRRYQVINDVRHDLDVRLRDDTKPEVAPFGAKTYDYLHTMYLLSKPTSPVYLSQSGPVDQNTPNPTEGSLTLTYYLSYEINGMETNVSDALRVTILPGFMSQGVVIGYRVSLRIPPGPAGITKRYLYRNNYNDINPYLLATFSNNNEITFIDLYRGNNIVPMPNDRPIAINAWFNFDEALGSWGTPILDLNNGSGAPAGQIFEAVPKLQFVNPNNRTETLSYNGYDVFSFFMKDATLENIRNQWAFTLKSIPILYAPVKNTDYVVGDSMVYARWIFPMISPQRTIAIRKAVCHLIKEVSEVEAYVL